MIDGVCYPWSQGDVLSLPPWAWHEHVNRTAGDAYLFSVTDKPVLETFGYYRMEAFEERDGRQAVTGDFDG